MHTTTHGKSMEKLQSHTRIEGSRSQGPTYAWGNVSEMESWSNSVFFFFWGWIDGIWNTYSYYITTMGSSIATFHTVHCPTHDSTHDSTHARAASLSSGWVCSSIPMPLPCLTCQRTCKGTQSYQINTALNHFRPCCIWTWEGRFNLKNSSLLDIA